MKKKIAIILLLSGLVFMGGGFLLNSQKEEKTPQENEESKEVEPEKIDTGIYGQLDTRFEIINNVAIADTVKYYVENHSNEVQQISNIVINLYDKNKQVIEQQKKEVNQPCNPGQQLLFEIPFQTDISQIDGYQVAALINDGVES